MAGVTTAYEFCSVVSQAQIEMASSSTPAGPVHVLDAYAMANSVLCSRRPGAGREGAPSPTMITNCGRHLRATIEHSSRPLSIPRAGQHCGQRIRRWSESPMTLSSWTNTSPVSESDRSRPSGARSDTLPGIGLSWAARICGTLLPLHSGGHDASLSAIDISERRSFWISKRPEPVPRAP
jgi:hypothetical protein